MAKALNIEGLNCHESALEGVKLVLRSRMEEMCALREKALDWSDIAGVHDMRVASRRLRSALRDFLPLLPKRIPRKRLKALAGALGAVRDEDVAIDALDKLRASAKRDVAAGIEQLIEERRSRRDRARAILKEAISAESLNKLKAKFITSLEEKTAKAKAGRAGKRVEKSFRDAGREVILSRSNELCSMSVSLYQPFEIEPLHRMRIAAKRLRYAIELFTQCWPERIASFAEEIAKVQKSLGELHDCDVWIADLGARLVKLNRMHFPDKEVTVETHTHEGQAAIWLLRHFMIERTKHYRDALTRWHEWEMSGFFSSLQETLDSKNWQSIDSAIS